MFQTARPLSGQDRADQLFRVNVDAIHRHADAMFARLMIVQWVAAIAAACWVSPRTWIGAESSTHVHVWAAVFLGGLLTAMPVYLARAFPGRVLTRHCMAVAQTLFSALLIHLTGGRIETHFHVFGSLAFLTFYRDWRVLATATAVVAVDHAVRGIFWPQSVFGVLTSTHWRWLEHAGWVMFEDVFLFISIRQSTSEMREVAVRRASLEASERRLAQAQRVAHVGSWEWDVQRGGMVWSDEQFRLLGLAPEKTQPSYDLHVACAHPEDRDHLHAWLAEIARSEDSGRINYRVLRPDGTVRIMHSRADVILDERGRVVRLVGTCQDVTEREQAEERIRAAGEALLAANEKLEARVTERTAELIRANVELEQEVAERKDAEAKLEALHKQLLETSRQAGMAEVATSVLHNVGNVLNSVNISCSTITSTVRKSGLEHVTRMAGLLRDRAGDLASFFATDPVGQKLPDFLNKLGERLLGERASVLKELGQLGENIDHIKDIVAMQQNYGRVSGITEIVKAVDLVEDSLRMNLGALRRHEVELIRDFVEVPVLKVERHKVLQILVNLIRNAKYACDESGRTDKQLMVRIRPFGPGIRISIIDNGVGIPEENLTRIFGLGFTTRKEGHGYGLHSAVLAAQELGGTLAAQSDGPGRGAIFTLDLPLEPPVRP